MRSIRICLLLFTLSLPFAAPAEDSDCFPPEVLPDNRFPVVRLETSMGEIQVELNRRRAPHSATNQFYFNLAANSSLDPNSRSWGYAVFGQVISGQDVVEAIAAVDTGYHEGLDAENVPLSPVKLLFATVMD